MKSQWVTSNSKLWLLVDVEGAFDVFHTGYLQRLRDNEDLFYLEPLEGGGVFCISAAECSDIFRGADPNGPERTQLIFSDGKGVNLKIFDCLPSDPINRSGVSRAISETEP